MSKKPYFLKCEKCGNIVAMVDDRDIPVSCCGEKMHILIPNTVDASVEKHVPVATKVGNVLEVTVGSVDHPMIEEHYIQWICVMTGSKVIRERLEPGQAPKATFEGVGDDYQVYAYCNLHGLWSDK